MKRNKSALWLIKTLLVRQRLGYPSRKYEPTATILLGKWESLMLIHQVKIVLFLFPIWAYYYRIAFFIHD